jgi:2-dehydro-3-deoxyphosphogluconate aldolase/(4S)-4-hydroxy-2-oxoglutarate aldolase
VERVTHPESLDGADQSNAFFHACLGGQRVMAILRGLPPDDTVALCERAWQAGIAVVEVPIQDPGAINSLRAAVKAGQGRGRIVGAGTVVTVDQVDEAQRAGAAFTVAPGLDEEVANASLRAGLAHLPGVATPSEVQRATSLGFQWMKAFPAAQLSPGWIRAILAPFPTASFVATGGIDADNAAAFLSAGARVVAVGSALVDPRQLRLLSDLQVEY